MKRFSSGVFRVPVMVLVWAILLTSWTEPVLVAATFKPLEIKERYRQVLTHLAAGDQERALVDLMTLEQAAVGEQQAWRYVDKLWRAKLQVIRDLLSKQEVDLLMPIIVLHHDAYFEYSRAGRRHLAQHSRMMTGELADIYAERATTPSAAAFSGWVMTSFAAYLWSPSNIGESANLFFRGQLLDPGNVVALEGLSAAYERGGNYDQAIENLRRAIRLDRQNSELLLRLALCHLRSIEGDKDRALSQLEVLVGPQQPDWIRSVAYQELVRARVGDGQVDSAEAILREALRELPGDQQLSLQLASLLDGQRRRNEAIAVLDSIQIGSWEQDSPRQIYDFWMPPDLEKIRDQLHQEMESGVSALAASLSSGASS